MVPLLPAAKDALSARYTHEMLVNAKTTELALMIFGTTGEWLFFFQEESSLASFFFSLFVFAHVVDPSFFSFDLFQPPFQKKNAESSNLLNDEEPQNFRHIVAPKGIDAEGAGRPLLEPVSPAAVLLPLEELIARALADDANKRRCRKASSSSFSSSSSPPPRADTLDVVLVAHSILLSALGGHEAATESPCSKTRARRRLKTKKAGTTTTTTTTTAASPGRRRCCSSRSGASCGCCSWTRARR